MKAIGLRAWFARMPWKRGHSPLTPVPEYENYVYDQWEHGNFDDFWKQIGIYAAGYYDQFVDAPMVHMSSWYDPYPRTASENYIMLLNRDREMTRRSDPPRPPKTLCPAPLSNQKWKGNPLS